MTFNTNLQMYTMAAATYASIRKAAILTNADMEYLNADTKAFERRPMLAGTKTAIVLASGLMGPYLLPINLYNDLNRLSIMARQEPPAKYNYQYKTMMDYLYG